MSQDKPSSIHEYVDNSAYLSCPSIRHTIRYFYAKKVARTSKQMHEAAYPFRARLQQITAQAREYEKVETSPNYQEIVKEKMTAWMQQNPSVMDTYHEQLRDVADRIVYAAAAGKTQLEIPAVDSLVRSFLVGF